MAKRSLSDEQLEHMVTCGLVTHFLVLPTADFAFSIDPNLIGSLSGVTVTIVLDDGRVAIGCPDEVPEVIAEFAVPIPQAGGGFPLADTAELSPVEPSALLQQMADQLNGLAQVSTPDFAPVVEALARIEGQVTTLRTQSGATDAMLSSLEGRLDTLTQAGTAPQDDAPTQTLDAVVDRLDQAIRTIPTRQIEGLLARIETEQQAGVPSSATDPAIHTLAERIETLSAAHAEIVDAVRSLTQNHQAITELPVPRVDLTSVHKANARLAAAMGTALQRMEKLTEDRLTGPDLDDIMNRLNSVADHQVGTKNQIEDLGALIRKITEQTDQVSQPAAITMEEILSSLEALGREVLSLSDRTVVITPIDGPEMDKTNVQLEQIQQDLAGLVQTMAQVKPQTDIPAPRLDMTPVHQANARMANAMNTALQRMEKLTEDRQIDMDDSPVTARLDALSARQEQVLTAAFERADRFEGSIAELRARLQQSDTDETGLSDAVIERIATAEAATCDAIQTLGQSMQDLLTDKDNTAPRIDLTPVHQAHARLATAMNTALQRMERTAADREKIIDIAPIQEQMAAFALKLDAGIALSTEQLAEMTELLSQHSANAAQVPAPDTEAATDLLKSLLTDQTALRHLADAQNDTLDGLRHGLAELMACQIRDRVNA